jgi:2-polyprenyl-6-methoxyphenol hydroxylase-like FAD-dependent oxidoreductase
MGGHEEGDASVGENGPERRREPLGERVVVVGASMSGLASARVLSDRFEEVVVLDRDTLPGQAEWRPQVPQGRHPHLLLTAGARLLEGWFPGIVDELETGGAVDVDLCRDFYWHQSGGSFRRPASSLRGPAMSRPFLEHAVRQRVAAIPNVTISDETTANGVSTDSSRNQVTGVRVADGSVIGCDLVVDASGRQARSLAWIRELGYEPPPVSVVTVGTRYVTRVLRRSDEPARDWKAAAVIGQPSSKRMGMAIPVEGDRWFVLLGGLNGEQPPTDHDGMLAYARSFDSPVIAEILEVSEPLGDAVTHRFSSNQRRHVERLRRFPLGWVLIGDAVSSFNPIYGQGMTSALQQAHALGACLDPAGAVDRSFTRRYFKAAAKIVAVPWSIAVGGDFVYDGTTGKKPPGTDLLNRYMERVNVASQRDDAVLIRISEVIALLRSPSSILTPGYVMRVWWNARRGPAEGGVLDGKTRVSPGSRRC